MKTLRVILILVLLVVGLTASVSPSLAGLQNPTSSPAPSLDRSGHPFPPLGTVPLSDPVDCAGGGC